MKVENSKYYCWYKTNSSLDEVELYKTIKDFIYTKFKKPLIFDIGCGQGFISNYLSAIGFDINRYAIQLAKKRYPDKNFYKIGSNDIDLKKMKLKKANVVVCLNLIEHLEDDYRNKFMNKIIPKVLKKNGYIIFTLYKQYHFLNILNMLIQRGSFFDPTHVHNWTKNQFITEVANYFEVVTVQDTFGYTKLTFLTKFIKTETILIAKLKND